MPSSLADAAYSRLWACMLSVARLKGSGKDKKLSPIPRRVWGGATAVSEWSRKYKYRYADASGCANKPKSINSGGKEEDIPDIDLVLRWWSRLAARAKGSV